MNIKGYRYQMLNYTITVKCYTDKEKAIEEDKVLRKIKQLTKNCPGIVPYFGMKKMLIELKLNKYHFLLGLMEKAPLKGIFSFSKNFNTI